MLKQCSVTSPDQILAFNNATQVITNRAKNLCLEASTVDDKVYMATCSNADNQKWTYSRQGIKKTEELTVAENRFKLAINTEKCLSKGDKGYVFSF